MEVKSFPINETAAILGLIAYLIGSIPSAVWIGKIFYSRDVREFGSHNAGATNTFRVLGKTAGSIVLVLDVFKGVAAVSLSRLLNEQLSPDRLKLFEICLGFLATIGHVYPAFARFKGGKGVATLTGVAFAIFPIAALITLGIFFTIFLLTNYISLSSISSSLLFPLTAYLVYRSYPPIIYTTLLLFPLVVIYTHRTNIQRLLKGEESKMYLFKKKVS